MKDRSLQRSIIAAAQEMNALGLNQGTSGNIGVRADDKLLLTPSGVDYDELTPSDIVSMNFDGRWSVETLAEMYWRALQIGEPTLLSKDEMQRVLDKFKEGYGYGSQPDDES